MRELGVVKKIKVTIYHLEDKSRARKDNQFKCLLDNSYFEKIAAD